MQKVPAQHVARLRNGSSDVATEDLTILVMPHHGEQKSQGHGVQRAQTRLSLSPPLHLRMVPEAANPHTLDLSFLLFFGGNVELTHY